jgi:hypothetical protein
LEPAKPVLRSPPNGTGSNSRTYQPTCGFAKIKRYLCKEAARIRAALAAALEKGFGPDNTPANSGFFRFCGYTFVIQ